MKIKLSAVLVFVLMLGVAFSFLTPIFAQDETTTTDNYSSIQKDLKQDRLADALRRIQMLEQENRFLAKRVELLERDVNDIKNDRY